MCRARLLPSSKPSPPVQDGAPMSSTSLEDAPLSSLPERPVSSTFPAAAATLDLAAERGRATAPPPPAKAPRSGPMADRMFGWAAQGAALLTLAMLIGILLSLVL